MKRDELIQQKIASEISEIEEQQLYEDIRLILQQARERAYSSASGIMIYAYWNVGRRIVEQEQFGEKKAKYGSYLIKKPVNEIIR